MARKQKELNVLLHSQKDVNNVFKSDVGYL